VRYDCSTAFVAQWIEQEPSNLLVAGSIPAEGALNLDYGRVLAIKMPDIITGVAWIQAAPWPRFVSQHFLNYSTVLVDMEIIEEQIFRELFDDGLLAVRSSKSLKIAHLADFSQ